MSILGRLVVACVVGIVVACLLLTGVLFKFAVEILTIINF